MFQQAFLNGSMTVPEGYRLIALDRVDSTNDEARRRIAADGEIDLWVVAAEQTKGRGRRGRTWVSARGNLFCSLVLAPHVPMAEAAQLSFVAALAVHDALRAILPDRAHLRCKWPNDILLGGKKLAGILLEAVPGGDGNGDRVIIGIGVNIADFPADVEFPATSLKAEGFGEADVGGVLQATAQFLADWRATWRTSGFAAIRQAWKDRAAGLGHEIIVRLERESHHGIFTDLGPRGELLLTLTGGDIMQVSAGDVFFTALTGASR